MRSQTESIIKNVTDTDHEVKLASLSLTSVPESLFSLTHITALGLGSNSLTTLPEAISALTCLAELDLSRNLLTCDGIPRSFGDLKDLRLLNIMGNKLKALPEAVCQLTNLYRLGLKGNQIEELPDSFGSLNNLVELFLTDNCLKSFPESMQHCTSLVKLQASHNQLESLPDIWDHLPKLELMRVAINNLSELPPSLWRSPALAWFSLASNPVCLKAHAPTHDIEEVTEKDVQRKEKLGDGASGDVYCVNWHGKDCAVKQFRADDASPDGKSSDEMAVQMYVDHVNLTKALGHIDEPQSLLLELVKGKPMAEKPNLESLLRCRWDRGASFSTDFALQAAYGTASALDYMHQNSIAHGDVYAHNILAGELGEVTLCDYGASFFYKPEQRAIWEPMEVRAWGLFLKDVCDRLTDSEGDSEARKTLLSLIPQCLATTPSERPSFQTITAAVAQHLRGAE